MERPDPTEFVAFMRDSAKRALDNVSERVDDLDKPARSIVKKWSRLDEAEKDGLLDALITSWMTPDEEPEPVAAKKARKKPTKSAKKK
jgi:hypothetical protein